ncbi:MAG: 4-alpha-glucanotransferase [Acidobacteria bacterium]|nr:4-alpha-glucanotransferase [Acidobacteriota bacterium]
MKTNRTAGVILHPTSLPSRFGIGDFGPTAAAYVEWLAGAGATWWQVLPLHPPGPGDSPYSAISTFAGNELLISPDLLVEDGVLSEDGVTEVPDLPAEWVDYEEVRRYKIGLLRRAYLRFRDESPPKLMRQLAGFREQHRAWLADYTLFRAIRDSHDGMPWYEWPRPLARRDSDALVSWMQEHQQEVDFVEFCQFFFFRQWTALRDWARELGVGIFGDVPIFVARDSAEVWAHPEIFLLDEDRNPTVVAGVPPDYFSETGQLWGNPLYDWDYMAADGYSWWISRLRHMLEMADLVRLDHFRGFAAYWEVSARAETAVEGNWRPGPGRPFFEAVRTALGALPLVAEDLGEITPDVVALKEELGIPGMAILHFAFSPEPRSTFIPYALERNSVVYTGTHDNNTSVGWYLEDASEEEKDLVRRYASSSGREIHWDLIRLALGSVADTAIVPHQDLAGLGADCRMNTPAVGEGNWRFRITPRMLGEGIQARFWDMVEAYGRMPAEPADVTFRE